MRNMICGLVAVTALLLGLGFPAHAQKYGDLGLVATEKVVQLDEDWKLQIWESVQRAWDSQEFSLRVLKRGDSCTIPANTTVMVVSVRGDMIQLRTVSSHGGQQYCPLTTKFIVDKATYDTLRAAYVATKKS